jgi:hypothetical protein
MAKVIVERPRIKSYASAKPKGYARRLRRYGPDGPPEREGIKACWANRTKSLNEHLGPLRRYLDAQVGRPWDKVFSEICAHIDRSSAVQDHVRDHVAQYVTAHVVLIEGVPHNAGGDPSHGRALHDLGWRSWYVCPKTGLLRRVKRRKPRPKKKAAALPPYVRVSNTLQCRFVDGAWMLVTLHALPPVESRLVSRDVDVILQRPVSAISPGLARQTYGIEAYAIAKRRMGRQELRQYPIPLEHWR